MFLVAATIVGVTGVGFALVARHDVPERVPSTRALRSILGAPGMRRLLLVACFYIVVLQALLTYTVPSARAAGLSAFAASATYLAVRDGDGRPRRLWVERLIAAGARLASARLSRPV